MTTPRSFFNGNFHPAVDNLPNVDNLDGNRAVAARLSLNDNSENQAGEK